MYISVHPFFNRAQTHLKYSQNERVKSLANIKHPIFREALEELWPQGGLEIVSTADIPAGSGLGSSSSFTVALLHALYAYRGTYCSKEKLAQKACEIEIDRLGEPIGKQDQYAAAYGGLNFIEFFPDERVVVSPLVLRQEIIEELENNLLMFYTGDQRKTRAILEDQNKQVASHREKTEILARMVELAAAMREELMKGSTEGFARTLHEGWLLKRTLSGKISTSRINDYYDRALESGALGGKLLGAGGGGFLLLYCEYSKQEKLRKALNELYELPFRFEWNGSRIIYVGDRHTKEGFFC
jgi:D-glycero-alpha-D-manno-heptose-7-phosphate kinase